MLHVVAILTLLLTLPQIPYAPPLIKIDVVWTRLPVTIYVDYEDSKCSPEENRAILDIAPIALEIHYQSNLRYLAEFSRESYIIDVKQVANPSQAQVTVTAEKLDNAAGLATAQKWDPSTSSWKDIRVKLDCTMARASIYARITVFLHELYHTMGVGHPENGNPFEIMGGAAWDRPIYPSTLTFYALYAARANMRATMVRLPSNIPYVMVESYNITLTRLENMIAELKEELNQTEQKLSLSEQEAERLRKTLENDIKTLDNRLDNTESWLETIEGRLNLSEESIRKLNTELSKYSSTVDALASKADELSSEVHEIGKTASLLNYSLLTNTEEISKLNTAISDLDKRVQNMTLLMLFSIAMGVNATALAAASLAIRGRSPKRGQDEHANIEQQQSMGQQALTSSPDKTERAGD